MTLTDAEIDEIVANERFDDMIAKSRILLVAKTVLVNNKPWVSQRDAERIAFNLWGIAGEQTRHIVEETLTQTLQRYNFDVPEISALIDVVEAECVGAL